MAPEKSVTLSTHVQPICLKSCMQHTLKFPEHSYSSFRI